MLKTETKSIRVLVVDDHTIVRQGVVSLLVQEGGFIVAEASDGDTAFRLVEEFQPDVVVMDVQLGETSGIDATERILQQYPNVRVLGLSISTEREFVQGMLRAGARGYVLKQSSARELKSAIMAICNDEAALHPVVARSLLDQVQERRPVAHPDDELTAREIEVLELVARGLTSRQIAERLGLSIKTVNNHRAHVLEKLGARNRIDALISGIRLGLIRPEILDAGEPAA